MTTKKSKTTTIKKKGKKPITFKQGGLHSSTKTKAGQKITAAKHRAARSGRLGSKAKRQEIFWENVLKPGAEKARTRRKRGKK